MNSEKREVKNMVIRKSAMVASDNYDYKKICYFNRGFLECELEEKKEEVVFTYYIDDKKPLKDISKEKKKEKITALLDAINFKELKQQYNFSIAPENLYFDVNERLYVLNRDLYVKGESYDEKQFVNEYKALIGSVLQNKYNFDDYYNGGMDLLKKDKFLARILSMNSCEEIVNCLQDEYEKYLEDVQENKVEVNKRAYKVNRILVIIFGVLVLVGAGAIGYYYVWISPYQTAVNQANNAYMESDYVAIIEAMEEINVERLDVHQKYILALAYVKSENLTAEQKKNVSDVIVLNGDEKIMEYWIHLGRLEVEQAENIAMQLSNNQLLLYAYMKEKYMIESDTALTGEEKSSKLSEIDGKIEPLAKEYEVEE